MGGQVPWATRAARSAGEAQVLEGPSGETVNMGVSKVHPWIPPQRIIKSKLGHQENGKNRKLWSLAKCLGRREFTAYVTLFQREIKVRQYLRTRVVSPGLFRASGTQLPFYFWLHLSYCVVKGAGKQNAATSSWFLFGCCFLCTRSEGRQPCWGSEGLLAPSI